MNNLFKAQSIYRGIGGSSIASSRSNSRNSSVSSVSYYKCRIEKFEVAD